MGNPGTTYAETRHNAGFWFVNQIVSTTQFYHSTKFQGEICRLSAFNAWLLKPTTFMNLSGSSVVAFVRFYKIPIEQILVVHDDLDFSPGVARLKQGGGDGKHNGLKSIIAHLNNHQFMRLRLGIGHPGKERNIAHYVLASPPAGEYTAIHNAIANALTVLPLIVQGELNKAMQQLHTQ